jgi:hypothetical protein
VEIRNAYKILEKNLDRSDLLGELCTAVSRRKEDEEIRNHFSLDTTVIMDIIHLLKGCVRGPVTQRHSVPRHNNNNDNLWKELNLLISL